MIALAIFAGLLAIAVVLYQLGTRWLELHAAEIDGRPVPRRKRKRPVSRKAEEEPDQDEDDEEEAEAEGFAEAVREVDQLDQAGKRAWIEEMRAEGVEPEEIERRLNEREPVARLYG